MDSPQATGTPPEAVAMPAVAVKKRAQIANATRTMFIWIIVASIVLGFGVVGSVFLVQRLVYNQKVLNAQGVALSNIDYDSKNVSDLEGNLRALDADENLSLVKASPDDQPVQAILDALPSDPNSLALGASLQQKLLAAVPGLNVQSLQVDQDAETLGDGTLPFTLTVDGSQDSIMNVLTNFERSIRTINVTSLDIIGGDSQTMTLSGQAYYQPSLTFELKKETIKP